MSLGCEFQSRLLFIISLLFKNFLTALQCKVLPWEKAFNKVVFCSSLCMFQDMWMFWNGWMPKVTFHQLTHLVAHLYMTQQNRVNLRLVVKMASLLLHISNWRNKEELFFVLKINFFLLWRCLNVEWMC